MPDHSIDERLNAQDKMLSSIDTNLSLLRKELLGNGQPGRLNKVESEIDDLKARQNRVEGFWKGVNWLKAGIVVAVVEIFKYFAGGSHK